MSFQDHYEKVIAKNAIPLELCDLASNKKKCKKSSLWREFLNSANEHSHDDDLSREYPQDDIIDVEDIKAESLKTERKRNHPHKTVSQGSYDCATLKTHVDLGIGYYPRVIGNITCDYETNESHQICPRGWSCQPIKYIARVLSKYSLDGDIPSDIPTELKGCWLFEDIPIHVGCKCGRSR